MRTFLKRLAAAVGIAVAVTAGLGAPAAHAEPEPGCVGFPEFGGLYYYCLDENVLAMMPRVTTVGQTPVYTTVPAICYYLGCTPAGPVGVTLPVDVSVHAPSSDVVVFEFRTNCYAYYGCYDDPYGYYNYYRLYYTASTQRCRFQTDDPNVPSSGTVPCAVSA